MLKRMKRFFALVLVFSLSACPVLSMSASAASLSFVDAYAIDYADAVAQVSAKRIVTGYADGTFRPDAVLTRGAASKIICSMLLGATSASALVVRRDPFVDVAADSTFAGYIAYMANEGIVGGYSDGTFRPGANLTGYAFMKMLLVAMGDDTRQEGYVGANWSQAVGRRAHSVGLDRGLIGSFNGTKPVTRQEACLYVSNALNIQNGAAPAQNSNIFKETYWTMSFGQTNGGQYAALFHDDGTVSAYAYGSGTFTQFTYSYTNGILYLRGVAYTGDASGFISVEKQPMQVGYDYCYIEPDPDHTYAHLLREEAPESTDQQEITLSTLQDGKHWIRVFSDKLSFDNQGREVVPAELIKMIVDLENESYTTELIGYMTLRLDPGTTIIDSYTPIMEGAMGERRQRSSLSEFFRQSYLNYYEHILISVKNGTVVTVEILYSP